MLTRITKAVARRWRRRFYFLSRLFKARVPVHSISAVPDGFRIQPLAKTGITLVDNFCTPAEAALLIDNARGLLARGNNAHAVVNDVAVSGQLCLSGQDGDDPALLPLLYRAAILFGVSYTHVEKIAAGCVGSDPVVTIAGHQAPTGFAETRHCVLVFLNEVPGDAGGETVFQGANVAISPRVGRAVCYSLSADHAASDYGIEESMPLSHNAQKWFIRIWLADRSLRSDTQGSINPPQARPGHALTGAEAAPEGVWAPQDIDLEAVFGQPDKMKGLL